MAGNYFEVNCILFFCSRSNNAWRDVTWREIQTNLILSFIGDICGSTRLLLSLKVKKSLNSNNHIEKQNRTTYTERIILVCFKGKETNIFFVSFQPVFAKNCSFQFWQENDHYMFFSKSFNFLLWLFCSSYWKPVRRR